MAKPSRAWVQTAHRISHRFLVSVGTAICLLQPLQAVHAQSSKEGGEAPWPAGSPRASAVHYQFAVYYLDAPASSPVDVLAAVLKRMPRAPELVAELKAPPKQAVVRAQYNTQVQKNYQPPSLDMIKYFGRGLSRGQAVALQASRQALVMDFAHPTAVSAAAYRASLQLTEQLAREGSGLIWDEETREVFTPDEWHARRLDSWQGDTPDVLKHTVIHAYKGDKLVRAISLGMAKFGLPDLVVADFPWSSNKSMGNLINLLAQAMVEGLVVGPQGRVDLDLRGIKHVAVRQSQLSTLKDKATAKAPLILAQGQRDDGDPDNRLAEIRFDRVQGPDVYARQDALLNSLFGSVDQVSQIKHDEQLLNASKAAKAKLPALREAFNKGLQPGEYLLVKAPFQTTAGGREWMWVEVSAWQDEVITGLLKNEPVDVPRLHAGQMVKVQQQDLFDYIRYYANGKSEGNETGKIIERMGSQQP